MNEKTAEWKAWAAAARRLNKAENELRKLIRQVYVLRLAAQKKERGTRE